MNPVPGYVLDSSALAASLYEVGDLEDLMDDANAGLVHLYVPAVALADVEADLVAGVDGWAHLLYIPHLTTLPLWEAGALEMGGLRGSLAVRHSVLEARRLGASIVTSNASWYEGLRVALRVI